jgi:uncharacterized protein (TIGR03000 family)
MSLGTNRWPVWILTFGFITIAAGSARAQYASYGGSWGSSGSFGSYGSWGSSGGSSGYYGSLGSSGGSFGSYGSSGGSSGSYGSYGSSGGSYGSYGSSGGWSSGGSSGSWGSSGGSDGIYVHPHHHWPATPMTRQENIGSRVARRDEIDEDDARQGSGEIRKTPALLELSVPEDAVVRLAGQQMTLTGRRRVYFSQPLAQGKTYGYAVEVEVSRNGRVAKESISQPISAGGIVRLEAVFHDDDRLSLREIADGPGSTPLQARNAHDGAATKVAGH